MATNLGTKITINAFLRKITRMWLLITTGFRRRPIQRRHFWLQGSKGRCHGNQILAKISHNFTKMAITSVVCNISMKSLVLKQGLCYRGIHLWHAVHKRQRGVTIATNFGSKIAINAYKCISTRDKKNVITYNRGFSSSTNPKKTFLIARV